MSYTLSLGAQLRLLTAKLDGDLQGAYDDAGLVFRPRFFPMVQHLLNNGPATVTTLAQATAVSQPAATQTIGEMVRLGLVESAAAPDARERLISLTENGQHAAEKLAPIWEAVRQAAQELDSELPHPLCELLGVALDALDREPFGERIRRKLENG